MGHHDHLQWPFFDARHGLLARAIDRWAKANLQVEHEPDLDEACRKLVRQLGDGGWLKYGVGGKAYGGDDDAIDTRSICLIREALAYYSGLADFAFALQGLGSGAISLFGSPHQKERYLRRVAEGRADRGACHLRARCGFRCRRHAVRGALRRRRVCPRRREDVDFKRRHRRLLYGVRAHRRGRGRTRHQRLYCGCR